MCKYLKLTAAILVLMVVCMGGFALVIREPRGLSTTDQSGPTIEQIQALAQLVTEKLNVSDVIETQLAGRLGSIKVILLVKGWSLISTDLTKARFESIDLNNRRAVLVLPPPKVLESAIDHEQTHVFDVTETGLWKLTPGDNATTVAINDLAFRDAQRLVNHATNEQSIVSSAKEHTNQVLREFCRAGGWELLVKWAD